MITITQIQATGIKTGEEYTAITIHSGTGRTAFVRTHEVFNFVSDILQYLFEQYKDDPSIKGLMTEILQERENYIYRIDGNNYYWDFISETFAQFMLDDCDDED